MKITNIPFVKLIDIKEKDEKFSLSFKDNILNHVKTIHASAQFTLAETDSGAYLQRLFPELEGKVIPLLRDATIKYKKPAENKIVAYSYVKDENILKFQEQFARKGRGVIEVNVKIEDVNSVIIAHATFSWFITKI